MQGTIMHEYDGLSARFLAENERVCATDEKLCPLVLEPATETQLNPSDILYRNSKRILSDITKHGAVLFRRFNIDSEKAFQETILSIDGIRGISNTFMCEAGRDNFKKLKYVKHTNTFLNTSGPFLPPIGFHSENYYTPDVPQYIAFWCSTPPTYYGETGLINTLKTYHNLSEVTKNKIEKSSCFSMCWQLDDICKRYALSSNAAERICRDFGLEIINNNSSLFVNMNKPSVAVHPLINEKTLVINFAAIKRIIPFLVSNFSTNYLSKEWSIYRNFWKYPNVVFLIKLINSISRSPKTALQFIKDLQSMSRNINDSPLIGEFFDEGDLIHLSSLMRKYYSGYAWQKGDILLVDNLQMAHSAMPGFGSKVLRTILCNPMKSLYTSESSGVQPFVSIRNSLGEELVKNGHKSITPF